MAFLDKVHYSIYLLCDGCAERVDPKAQPDEWLRWAETHTQATGHYVELNYVLTRPD